jgi:hypothetical protein
MGTTTARFGATQRVPLWFRATPLSLFIRMNPFIRRNFLPFSQLNHADRRHITTFPARSAFQDASSFQIGVSRGLRIASSGKLARVLQRLHSTSNQLSPVHRGTRLKRCSAPLLDDALKIVARGADKEDTAAI